MSPPTKPKPDEPVDGHVIETGDIKDKAPNDSWKGVARMLQSQLTSKTWLNFYQKGWIALDDKGTHWVSGGGVWFNTARANVYVNHFKPEWVIDLMYPANWGVLEGILRSTLLRHWHPDKSIKIKAGYLNMQTSLEICDGLWAHPCRGVALARALLWAIEGVERKMQIDAKNST